MNEAPRETKQDSRSEMWDMVPRAIALLSVAAVMGLAACNTTAGAGKDISAAGNAIHNSAENAKSY